MQLVRADTIAVNLNKKEALVMVHETRTKAIVSVWF